MRVPARIAYALCLAVAALRPTDVRAQATVQVTQTSLISTLTAAHLNAASVLIGYVDVDLTQCSRGSCDVTMAYTGPGTQSLTFLSVAKPTTQTTASCPAATPLTGTASLLTNRPVNSGVRVFLCLATGWTIAPATPAALGFDFIVTNK